MENSFSLENKTILITGSSSGIGREIAIKCALHKGNVVITARNEDRLLESKNMLDSYGKHQIISTDLSLESEINDLVDTCPQLDGLVLNAGFVKTMPLKFLKTNSIDELFNVNIRSSILLVNKLIKSKKINPGGSICFISSVASQKSTVGNSVYSATKGAVNSFTKAIALELAPKQIRSNAILPGFVQTEILNQGAINQESIEIHKKNYPLGRFGEPSDIANLAVYLLSDASQWMTGTLLKIDGGYSLK